MIFIAGLCAIAYLFLTTRPVSLGRSVIKTAAVALLAFAAWSGAAPALLVLALALCALGDWMLSNDGDAAFMAGVGAFAAGHLTYIALFLTHPLAEITRIGQSPQVWLVTALFLLGMVMARILVPLAGELRLPVLIYIPIILGMGMAVLALPGQGPLGWALPAALAFIVSDLVLSVEKFVLLDDHPALRFTPYVVWVFYWCAQLGFLIALS